MPGVDGVAGYNTHTVAIQVPTSQVATFGKPTIGVYAEARVGRAGRSCVATARGARTVRGSSGVAAREPARSNEVVIPLGKKDLWNASDPQDDSQFVQRVRSPR